MHEAQKEGLQDAERMLRDQVGNDSTLKASGLRVAVKPRARNVAALYERAKRALQVLMPTVSLDKFGDMQVRCTPCCAASLSCAALFCM